MDRDDLLGWSVLNNRKRTVTFGRSEFVDRARVIYPRTQFLFCLWEFRHQKNHCYRTTSQRRNCNSLSNLFEGVGIAVLLRSRP